MPAYLDHRLKQGPRTRSLACPLRVSNLTAVYIPALFGQPYFLPVEP